MRDLVARIRGLLVGRLLRRRVLFVAVPVFVLAAPVAAYFLVPGILVRARAAALGVELDWDRLELSSGAAELRGVRAKLVGVSVDADSRDLAGAKVRTTAGVGCGLKLPGL